MEVCCRLISQQICFHKSGDFKYLQVTIIPPDAIDSQVETPPSAKNQPEDDGTFKLPQAKSQRKNNRSIQNNTKIVDTAKPPVPVDASFAAVSKPRETAKTSQPVIVSPKDDTDDDDIEIVDEIVCNAPKKQKVELPPLPEAPPQPSILTTDLVPPKPLFKVIKREKGEIVLIC